ncbi:MAG: hypothetical protein ACLR0P_06890 [Oscillospiraceae bacterium]
MTWARVSATPPCGRWSTTPASRWTARTSLAAAGKRRRSPSAQRDLCEVTVTDEERAKIHAAVEELAGKVENMRPEENKNPNTLVGALAKGSSYDSISYGSESLVVGRSTPLR